VLKSGRKRGLCAGFCSRESNCNTLNTLQAERRLACAERDDARNQLKILNDRLQLDLDRWAILQRKTVSEQDLRQAVAGSRALLTACGQGGSYTEYVFGPHGSGSTVRVCYHFKNGELYLVSGEHSGHDGNLWCDRFRFERRDDKFVRIAEPREQRPLN
jgi:hypothetical protein